MHVLRGQNLYGIKDFHRNESTCCERDGSHYASHTSLVVIAAVAAAASSGMYELTVIGYDT